LIRTLAASLAGLFLVASSSAFAAAAAAGAKGDVKGSVKLSGSAPDQQEKAKTTKAPKRPKHKALAGEKHEEEMLKKKGQRKN
jgi:hypothetical protein